LIIIRMAATRRLQMEQGEILKAEAEAMEREESIGWSIGPVSEDSLLKWQGAMDGPPGTPYEGGRFEMTIDFPADYPFTPVRFRSREEGARGGV
jgi:ubiquitin-protein ligase